MGARRRWAVLWSVIAFALALAGCTSTRHPAPVSDRTHPPLQAGTKPAVPAASAAITREPDTRPDFYTVKRGDTLYMIALDHGLDYKELAEWNNIDNPNVIRGGQQLRLRAPASTVVATPLKNAPTVQGKPVTGAAPAPATSAAPAGGEALKSQPKGVKLPYSEQALAQLSAPALKPPAVVAAKPEPRSEEKPAGTEDDDEKIDWGWPTAGKLLSSFNESTNLKGIGIAGKAGQSIIASAPGKVLYSGDGIRGYGKLVIVKHNKVFLSVYAHNSLVTVKEGQSVVKGQKIAEMGNSDADQVNLHFEIRRFGKPVDPMRLLPGDRPN
jgi:lipoprotein NlpD